MKRILPVALLALAACAEATTEPLTSVRHVPSNVPYGQEGARLHLFIFDPSQPRSLDDRKAIARRQIALEPRCAWVDAPDAVLVDETRKQGERFTDTMLVAPLRCSRT
ncbi:MAG: hypothetical protein KJO67_13545 [Silicimonas sp.]|nr:hypothetical protein [Silicimonas sp.]